MARTLTDLTALLSDLAPLAAAEDWDNVGWLLEPEDPPPITRVLLAIDLTESVLVEALSQQIPMILAYHPVLFKGLKRLTSKTPTERIVRSALRHGLAVYSPHTALDAAIGGMADWLAGAFGPGETRPLESRPTLPPGVGAGRLLRLEQPLGLQLALERVKAHLGLPGLRLAAADCHAAGKPIETVAVCPGAGGSLFERLGAVDLLLTGEMRHHDVLSRRESGTSVMLTDHTHCERGYLPLLADKLRALAPDVDFLLSKCDREPLVWV